MTKVRTYVKGTLYGLLGLIGSCTSTYIVNEKEQAVVTRLGNPVRVVVGSLEAGKEDSTYNNFVEWHNKQESKLESIASGANIRLKLPWPIESVNTFEDRILEYDAAPTDVVTKDKKHILIDNYSRWRIKNPLKFMLTVRDENSAQSRIDDIIYSIIRENLGENDLIEVVRSSNDPIETTEKRELEHIYKGREVIMKEITRLANSKADDYGIEIVDVRIKRADLPPENTNAVYGRMSEERARIAKQYRSEGEEQRIKIMAQANRDTVVIMTEAYKEAERIRGEGDAEALKIYANAYSKNPQFFKLLRTLESYKRSFGDDTKSTKLVLPLDSEYNKYLKGRK